MSFPRRLCGRVSPWFVVFVAALGVAGISLLVPADDPFPGRDPGVMRPEDLIVAVLDSGVDASHRDLKDVVLKGWNVLDGSDDTSDKLGHGTAVAGIIAARGEGEGRMKGLAPGVRILPVKVVSDASADTVAPMLTIGIEYALKQNAKIICIPLGAPRGTKSLSEALDHCRDQGVLVVAAAGIASGTQDYWPAAHPWAVSCTSSMETVLSDKEGKPGRTVLAVASRANLTPKTEVAGNPSVQSLRPGDSYGPLEGTSTVTARAAGIAARLWLADATLKAADVRRLLVESGGRIGTPNFQNVYRATVLDLDAALATVGAGNADLSVKSAILRPYPWHPGEKRLGEAVVTNSGLKKAGGKLVVDIDKAYSFDIPELDPGATKTISFEIPAEANLESGRARIALENVANEKNTGNNVLTISVAERPKTSPSVMVQSAGVEKLGIEPGKAVIYAVVRNLELTEELPAEVHLKTSNATFTRPVRIAAGAETRVEADWDIPEAKTDVIEVSVEVKGQTTDSTRSGVFLEDGPVTMQYADVWDRDEIIFDMPWAVVEGRTEIPLLVFVPETKNVGMAIDGVWLKDIKVWRRGAAGINGFMVDRSYWGVGEEPMFGATTGIGSVSGKEFADVPGGPWERFLSIPVEDESGRLFKPNALSDTRNAAIVGAIRYPSWHRIIRLPIAEPEPEMYFTARATATYFRFRTSEESKGFPSLDQDEITIKVMCVQQKKAMPKLSNEGKYWDTHVHTAAEYSTDIVDPRLAWGGPPRMLVWTAYSLGMLDSTAPGSFRDKLITTDHNCFFSDNDVPKFPPFDSVAGSEEYRRLRELIGQRTGGQEVSMYRLNSPAGSAHALVYEHHSHLPGPWFGDRLAGVWIKPFISYIDDALFFAMNVLSHANFVALAAKLGFDLVHDAWTEKHGVETWQKLQDEAEELAKEGKHDSKTSFIRALKMAACLTPAQLQRLKVELDLCLKNAEHQVVPNPNTQLYVIEQMTGSRAQAFAAHPVNESFAWTGKELDDWFNFSEESSGRFATRDAQFVTSGLQIWNDPKKKAAHLLRSADLFFLNPWSATWKLRYDWHRELNAGFVLFDQLSRKGMRYTFLKNPDAGTFIRKIYISAGSDAHGDFNYATGVTASIMSHHGLEPFLLLFNSSSGAEAYDAAYAKCRTYAIDGKLDDFYHGRTTLTDGPLVDFKIDSDLRFEIGPPVDGKAEERAWLWHDKWEKAEQGKDEDGKIGGEGVFDGGGTAAVRKGCIHLVANLRSKTAETWGGDLTFVDAYWWDRETPARFQLLSNVNTLMPNQDVTPFEGPKAVRLKFAPTVTGAISFGGFSSPFERYHPESNQCFTNPVWYTTIDIKSSVGEVKRENGKAYIPTKKLVVHFTADISMQRGLVSRVFIQQLNSDGDSFGPRIPLQALGPWSDPPADPADPEAVGTKRSVFTAINAECAIPVVEPWYPQPGTATWCVVLADVVDTNGNRLNEVASTFAAGVPVETLPPKDPSGPGDPGANDPPPGETPTPKASSIRPPDSAAVCVNAGDRIDLPKGASLDGQPIPPGPWSVPDLPEKGLTLAVTCGGQVLTVLLTRKASDGAPWVERGNAGFYGSAPAPGKGPVTLTLKNHSQKTVEHPEALVVTPTSCVFSAPQAEPGACDLTIAQGGASKTYALEAVAAKIAWDAADAQVGDVRELRLALEGASRPGDWTVSGTVELQSGQLVVVGDPARIVATGAVLTIDALPGNAAFVARVKALQTGAMVAHARLRALKK